MLQEKDPPVMRHSVTQPGLTGVTLGDVAVHIIFIHKTTSEKAHWVGTWEQSSHTNTGHGDKLLPTPARYSESGKSLEKAAEGLSWTPQKAKYVLGTRYERP